MTRLFTPVGKGPRAHSDHAERHHGDRHCRRGRRGAELVPLGELFPGAFTCTIFVFLDMLDGVLARMKGTTGTWARSWIRPWTGSPTPASSAGSWCGSHSAGTTRCSPGVLVLPGHREPGVLREGSGAGIGAARDVGLIERPERMVISLVCGRLSGLGVPYILNVGLWGLAAGSAFTFWQRVHAVLRQRRQ